MHKEGPQSNKLLSISEDSNTYTITPTFPTPLISSTLTQNWTETINLTEDSHQLTYTQLTNLTSIGIFKWLAHSNQRIPPLYIPDPSLPLGPNS